MKKMLKRMNDDPAYFIGTLLRYAFAILFILVAVKKFRMGYANYVDGLVNAETLVSEEIPSFLLLIYAYALPLVELGAGLLLLINKHTKAAYQLIALVYLTFIFGQEYDGNTSKVGTEYLPSLVALSLAYWTNHKILEKK